MLGQRANSIIDTLQQIASGGQTGIQPQQSPTSLLPAPANRMGQVLESAAIGNPFRNQGQPAGSIVPAMERQNVQEMYSSPAQVGSALAKPTMPPEVEEKAVVADAIVRKAAADPEAAVADPTFGEKVKGFFGNEENMLRLAMAFNTMRMEPDPNIATFAADRLKTLQATRIGTEQRNKTVQALIDAKRPDLAQAVKSGILDAKSAASILFDKTKKPDMVEQYEYAKSQGYPGSFTEFKTLSKPDAPKITIDGRSYDVGTIPQGMRLITEDGVPVGMEPIKGSDQELERQAAEEAAKNRAELARNKGSVIGDKIDSITSLIKDKEEEYFSLPVTGVVGSLISPISQDAKDLKLELQAVQSMVAFDTLQKMREASKTGGALGSVSERELDLLMSAYGSLDQGLSAERLLANLQTIKDVMLKIESDPIASQMYYQGANPSGSVQLGGSDGFSVSGKVD